MLINKAILPIAGLGTRFLPITKVIPKEMMPINGVPILQLLIEEAYKAGVHEFVLVINRQKESIIRKYLSREGKNEKLDRLNKLLDDVKIEYVYQDEQLGDGHALLQARESVEDEPFLVLFGDDLVIGATPDAPNAAKQLIEAHEKTGSSVIALEEIDPEMSESYGIIKPAPNETGPLYKVEDLVEKPSPSEAPSNLGVIGKYICTPDIWTPLSKAEASVGNEIRLIDGFKKLLSSKDLYGLKIEGKRYDTGTLEGYKKAVEEV
ncbi:NTP transferase domain-containing protein [Candidatus Peregrinibacteria bacterium]|jgi:UTP--glucose-1-phosphate uridylyltransferase|nr:NTP transferase domain-containing protein [Candidatus Peregrinibacteria bacterium]MBT4148427.1 NTP transferase domain-containing protein [Candidatus Peregrinibacteria bacterium]MBT4366486.1 NTP transferase domain-containing protein [Candidatus Peregrinibacteria bacterium]MBT4456063.1 NTP transferase domain-containing protein [Candidatus Peregrinibacteria bacterium]